MKRSEEATRGGAPLVASLDSSNPKAGGAPVMEEPAGTGASSPDRGQASSPDPGTMVLEAAAGLVGAARRSVPWYAGDFAPIRSDQLAELLRRATCHVEIYAFGSDAVAMTFPPFRGRYPIFVNRAAERADRAFALRHELAHVLAGDVAQTTFLEAAGYMAPEERVADLFALADLVPAWLLRSLRRQRMSWRALLREMRAMIVSAYAEDWPEERLADRASLRLRLFREFDL